MQNLALFFLLSLILFSCDGLPTTEMEEEDEMEMEENEVDPEGLYFPPNNSTTWETTDMDSLGWNKDALPDLLQLLEDGDSRAFIVLKDGKIVIEEYWGNDLLTFPFDKNSVWYWASAAKTLTSFLVGKAEEDGFLDLEDSSSGYLGKGWTTLSESEEDAITVLNQLTMTSGLDDSSNSDCTDPECLKYKAEPNTRWAYHNAPYTLLDGVIEGATNQSFDDYFETSLKDPIGMDGNWRYIDYNHIFFSSARSMARFGLLMLNDGKWGEEVIMDNETFLKNSINSSQDLNPAYGYLWWLNGKSSVMFPGLQFSFNIPLSENAPSDMYAAMGKNAQYLNVVPSENLVVIRMGDNPNDALVPVDFQNDIWEKLNLVMNK